MALTTTITKKSVTLTQEGAYQVTVNLLYKDGDTVLLDQDFSERYKTGQAWSVLFANMKERIKTAIRHCKEEQAIFNAAGLDTVVTNLNNTVGV
jgi:hypothetical protein